MTIPSKNTRAALFPHCPRSTQIADSTGKITTHWANSFSNLYQTLQTNLTSTGYAIPSVTQVNLDTIQTQYQTYIGTTLPLNVNNISGQIAYNSDTKFINEFIIATDASNNIFLAQWVPLGILLLNNGDPNGVLGGLVGWSCYDLTNKHLYFCTIEGKASSAVWTLV